jgi:dTDP-4-dehydrorhamnose reductase
MRILLTGTTGQVGGEILRILQARADVVAPPRFDFDLSQPETLAAALDQINPDLIINPAAYTAVDLAEDEPELAFRINEHAPAAMAIWAGRRGVPLIHFSTDYVFSGAGEKPWREDDRCDPLSVYGKSKRAGEQRIAAVGGSHLIIRTSWVYGAQGKNFFRTICRLAADQPELRVVADQIGAPTSAHSIAVAVNEIAARGLDAMRASFADADGLVHLTSAGVTSWHGFASAIVDGLRAHNIQIKALRVIPIGTSEFPTKAARPQNSRLDLGHLQQVFGISTADWHAGLEREIIAFAKLSA